MAITDKFTSLNQDIGIDLGTANTMVWVKHRGIIIKEPSVVARHKDQGVVIAIGEEAKKMLGKTPKNIEAIRPLRDGVIADFDGAEAMLTYYIHKVREQGSFLHRLFKPRVAIGVPSGVTDVERRAVQEAAFSAGASEAYLIEESMAAAIGAGIKVAAPEGRMIVDIGGGTAEIAVISLGGLVLNRSIRIAGDELDEAIIRYVKIKYGLLIGAPTAEQVKIAIGSVVKIEKTTSPTGVLQIVVRGRDTATGLPKSIRLNSIEIRDTLLPVVIQIITTIIDCLEETPPELVSDILERGIALAGGSSLLRGLDQLISEETKIPAWRIEDPLSGVARGCGAVLQDRKLLERVKVVGSLR